jgi:putative redox protein
MVIWFNNIGYFYKINIIINKNYPDMAESINIALKGEMSFEAEVDGHKIMIDTAPEFGGKNMGPKPKSLMMVALAGCTGMDIASMLRKMKVEFTDLNVEVRGNLTETHPKHFDHMHIIYKLKGEDISLEKVQKAVDLSKEKYCGVSYNYKGTMEITHEIIIEK